MEALGNSSWGLWVAGGGGGGQIIDTGMSVYKIPFLCPGDSEALLMEVFRRGRTRDCAVEWW